MKKEERIQSMIQDLVKSREPLDITYFLDKYQIKLRTARYDIETLRNVLIEQGVKLQYRHKDGYYIAHNEKLMLSSNSLIIEELMSEERLIYWLLLFKKDYISTSELALMIHRSETSVLLIIKSMNLSQGIKIDIQRYQGIKLIGDEYAIRKHAIQLIEPLFSALDDLHDLPLFLQINEIDIEWVKTLQQKAKQLNQEFNVWISHQSLMKFLSFVVISKYRDYFDNFEFIDYELNDWCKKESEYVNRLLCGEMKMANIYLCIRELLVCNITFDIMCTDEDLASYIGLMINESSFNYQAGLKEDLMTHLFQYIRKVRLKIQLPLNPLTNQIKQDYQIYFNEAKRMCRIIDHHYGIEMGDDEISYVAIYLYKHIQEDNQKKRVLIVCATGKGISQLLDARIKNVFPMLEIVDVVSVMSSRDYQVDLIISTIPISNVDKDVIVVSPILGLSDIKRIQEYLSLSNIEIQTLPKMYMPKTMGENESWKDYASNMRDITLTLLEIVNHFKDEYHVTSERMIGLMIHLMIAVERWMDVKNEFNSESEMLLISYQQLYPMLYQTLNDYFDFVENLLCVSIDSQERLAIYNYIV